MKFSLMTDTLEMQAGLVDPRSSRDTDFTKFSGSGRGQLSAKIIFTRSHAPHVIIMACGIRLCRIDIFLSNDGFGRVGSGLIFCESGLVRFAI